jgi:hypothetical protein
VSIAAAVILVCTIGTFNGSIILGITAVILVAGVLMRRERRQEKIPS